MANPPFDLEVITPEGSAFRGAVTSARLPTAGGSFGVLAGHAPLLAALDAGPLLLGRDGGKDEVYAVGEGFVEVRGKGVRVLVDFFETRDEIDVERARKAEERARERLRSNAADLDRLRAEAALRRAVVRLTVAKYEAFD